MFRVHRIVKKENQEYVLKGDGSFVFEEKVGKKDIIGVVIGFYLGEKMLSYNRNTIYYIVSKQMIAISLLKCKVPYNRVVKNRYKRIMYWPYVKFCDLMLKIYHEILCILCTGDISFKNAKRSC